MKKSVALIVDLHAVAHWCFHGYRKGAEGGLTNGKNVPTTVTHGSMTALISALYNHRPDYLAIATDGTLSWRKERYPEYKANREESPAEFLEDLGNLKILLEQIHIPVLESPRYEADDIIGTLVRSAPENVFCKVLTGDKDMFQLVDDSRCSIIYLRDIRNEYDEKAVYGKMGVPPHLILDYKAFVKDASDNIPGVNGVGEKRAAALLSPTMFGQQDEQGLYGGHPTAMDRIFAEKAKISGKYGGNGIRAEGSYESAMLSREMATLAEVPNIPSVGDCPLAIEITPQADQIFSSLAMNSVRNRLAQFLASDPSSAMEDEQEEDVEQVSLELSSSHPSPPQTQPPSPQPPSPTQPPPTPINDRLSLAYDDGDRYAGMRKGDTVEVLVNEQWLEATVIYSPSTEAYRHSWPEKAFSCWKVAIASSGLDWWVHWEHQIRPIKKARSAVS